MNQKPKITEIAFVSYAASDMARAQNFYENILGLTPTHRSETEHGIWQEYDIGSCTLCIGKMEGWNPGSLGGTAALEFEDFDAAIVHLKSAGVKFVMDPLETKVCNMAIIQDSEGNHLMVHQRKARSPH